MNRQERKKHREMLGLPDEENESGKLGAVPEYLQKEHPLDAAQRAFEVTMELGSDREEASRVYDVIARKAKRRKK